MSVKTKEEILTTLQTLLKDDTSDDAISILEDVTDTYDDLQTRANGDGTNWEQKYHDLDSEWRQKYRDRFFNHSADEPEEENLDPPEEAPEKVKFEDLFSQEGVN